MSRTLVTVALACLAGCSADDLAAEAPGNGWGCTDNSVTVTFTVEPATLVRNADYTLSVRWEAYEPLNDPVASLRVGDGPVVEVELPLSGPMDSAVYHGYGGSLLNPFGAGAPAGTVEVLAEAAPNSGCHAFPTAATAFELE
jgi:hypothetical protein